MQSQTNPSIRAINQASNKDVRQRLNFSDSIQKGQNEKEHGLMHIKNIYATWSDHTKEKQVHLPKWLKKW